MTPAESEKKKELEAEKEALREEKRTVSEEQEKIDERTDDVMDMRVILLKIRITAGKAGYNRKRPPEIESTRSIWFLTVDNEGNGIPTEEL